MYFGILFVNFEPEFSIYIRQIYKICQKRNKIQHITKTYFLLQQILTISYHSYELSLKIHGWNNFLTVNGRLRIPFHSAVYFYYSRS